MTSHAPKTGALIAYEGGLLSAKGRARVERHLAGCDVCRRELAVIRLYDEQADAIREAPAPKLDWSKMELALEREAAVQARRHRRQWMLPAAGVVLAAAAAVLLALEPPTSTPPTTSLASTVTRPEPTAVPGPTPPALAASSYDAVVTLVAGASELRAEEGSSPTAALALGQRIATGETISTSDAGSLHFALATDTEGEAHSVLAAALDPGSTLRVVALDGDEAPQLALDHGRVTVHMREARTIILAGQYRIEAEVASFVIDLDEADGDVAVDVREGEVRVVGPTTDTVLHGPSRFPSGTGALGEVEPVGLADDYDGMPTVHVSRQGIVRWQLGDTVAQGAGDIAMRVGVGRLPITGWDARGRAYHTTANVTADGLDLAPDELTPEAPHVRVGFLPEGEIVNVVQQRGHGARLRACYDRALHVDESLSVSVRADVTIEMTGSVETVRFRGEMPPTMAQCVTHEIQSWSFPAPDGGPVTFSLPLAFDPPN